MTVPLLESEVLSQGLVSLSLSVTEESCDLLLRYLKLIEKWNRVYNLTAVRDLSSMLSLHLMDSLAAVPSLRRAFAGDVKLLDVGSGAGLPGVVFAILNPEILITCVDTVGKKATFIRQVALELQLKNLHVEHARIETLPAQRVDIITSRAFASLLDFTQLTRHHLKPGAVWLAMKGKAPLDEISTLPADIDVFHVEQIQVPNLNAERCLVWMRCACPTV
jgi:16S rRNA (guanine527-N7)-methyltransferase